MRTLTVAAWVAVFAMFSFGLWAVQQPEPSSTARGELVRPSEPVILTPTTTQVVTASVPQVRTVTVGATVPTTTTTVQPQQCLVFLVDHCVTYAPG